MDSHAVPLPDARAVPNLIPPMVLHAYEADQLHGRFEQAITMFLDVSGFTAMTQALMQHGKHGAEVLSTILNRVFEPIIYAVYKSGGFISGFAGDAFTALFPSDIPRATPIDVATTIRQLFIEHAVQDTSLGAFSLAVKIGLSAGDVEWGIAGPPEHKTYYFRGPGIDGCACVVEVARQGDLILDQSVMALLPPGIVDTVAAADGYARVVNVTPTPPRAADRLSEPACRSATAFIPSAQLEALQVGEFRDAAIVFLSLKDSGATEQLHAFITQTIQSVDRFGGYFSHVNFGDKGCHMVVFFGAPIMYENIVQRALACLTALQADLRDLPEVAGVDWRAGITCGTAFAGLVGTPLHCFYTALGNAINLAARLMTQAAWGQILTSDTIAQQADFKFEALGQLSYKGFRQPIATFALLGEKSIEEKIFRQAMVGRQAELARLVAAAQPIFQGRFAGVAYIYGEPGMGKSRLLHELYNALGAETGPDGVTKLTAQTDQTLRQAFNPFAYLLKHDFEQSPDGSPDENHARFEQRVGQQLADLARIPGAAALADALARRKSFLGALVGLHWPDSPYATADAKGRYEQTMLAVKTWFLAESRRRPIVIELEDMHWLDEASHALMTTLTDDIAGHPIFVVATSRYADDGSRPRLELPPGTPTLAIELRPLAAADTRALVEHVLREQMVLDQQRALRIDDILYRALLDKTQSNPFYVQQLLYYFQENDLLAAAQHNGAQVIALRATPSDLPTSINAILVARIDRLSQQIKEVVKVAAVLGREFEVRVLSLLLRADVQSAVQRAAAGQIWSPMSELRFIFNHSLLRDAAYGMQARVRLAELHRLAGATIEQLYATNLAPYYADLAYHYGQAQVAEQERRYARLAGEQAAARFANAEAIRYLQRAIELTQRLPQTPEHVQEEIQLQLTLGSILLAIRGQGSAEMKQCYDHARALCQQLGDVPQLAAVLFGLVAFYLFRGELTTAIELAQQCERVAARAQDSDLMMEAHFSLSAVLFWLGQPRAAAAHARRVLALHAPGQHQDHALHFAQAPWVTTLMFASWSLWLMGSADQALALALDSVAQAEALALPFNIAIAIQVVAWMYWHRREAALARQYADRLLAYATEHHFPPYIGFGLLFGGWAMVQLGEVEPGLARLRGGVQAMLGAGSEFAMTLYALLLAEAYWLSGQLAEGLAELEKGIAWANRSREHVYLAELYRQKGEFLLAAGAGSPAQAEALFQQAIAVARAQGARLLELRAALSLGQLWRARGAARQRQAARDLLHSIYAQFGEGLDTPDLHAAARLLDEL